MPLVHQLKDIESYDCKEDEVKILRTKYDPATGKVLGIEYCVALITVKNDPEEQFFDYGYVKANSKCSIPLEKVRFGAVLRQPLLELIKISTKVECFLNKLFSKIFFYLPSTVDRCGEINNYLTSVYLKPFHVDISDLGESFNLAISFDRAIVVECVKKIAEQSSQNLKRNADAFLSGIQHGNDSLIWPGEKRTVSNKFCLTY